MNNILFSSALSSTYGDDLEALIFFNPQQGKVKGGIIRSVERYGSPSITVDRGSLRIHIGEFPDAQALFALVGEGANAELVGVVVYAREYTDGITILHIAVHENYSASGSHADEMLVMRLINEVREIGARIKGVHSLTLSYNQGVITRVSVSRSV